MLFNLLAPLADEYSVFFLFSSLTFRAGGAVVTGLIVAFVFGPRIIDWLKQQQPEGQPIRTDGPPQHFAKAGTPTMGGFLILLAIIVSTLLWADLTNGFVWAVLLITIGFGTIGFVDDYRKLTRASSGGLPGKLRLTLEVIVAAIAVYWIMSLMGDPMATGLALPFVKDVLIDHRIPRHQRDRLPLLCVGERIAWIPGVTVEEAYRLRDDLRDGGGTCWSVEVIP